MNELNGPFVVIVLGVREGRGFDFLQQPMLIEASLKGHKIDSDPVEPCPCPNICTELVWETEKKEVRKLRSSHVPLRIDCYTFDSNSQKFKIGFILMSLRSAAAITGDMTSSLMEAKWHRLVSVPSEYRMCRPELALTLAVRDRLDSPEHPIPTAGCSTAMGSEQDTTVIPIIYLEEGYIQIGNTSPKHQKFNLNFIIGTANNLDLLLNKDLVFNATNDKFYLALSVLGITINTKYLNKNLHDPIKIDEKIVFKLITNLEIFNLFLDEFKSVPLHFHHGQNILATAEINLKDFLANEQFDKGIPCKQEQVSEFCLKDGHFINRVDNRTPTIYTETILENKVTTIYTETILENKVTSADPSISNSQNADQGSDNAAEESLASGDQIRQNIPLTRRKNENGVKESTLYDVKEETTIFSMEDVGVQTTPRDYEISISSWNRLKNAPKTKKSLPIISSNQLDDANYHLYNLMIEFRSITWRKCLNIDAFQFKFQHPKANQALIINCDLDKTNNTEIMTLEDVTCIMYFLTTPENIKNLIAMYPPTVSLQTSDDQNLVDDFVLYTKILLKEGEDSCDYFAVLNTVNNKDELLCDLQIEMKINELSSGFTMLYDESDFNLDPIILDDWLALKTVKDLEEWKEKQEILFKDNLKHLECEKLEMLQAEWNLKRIELETKLHQGMEKCKVLSEELSVTANELRVKKRCLEEKLTSPDSRENIEIKVTQMLEEEMNRNVQRIEAEKQKLMKKIDQIAQEKINLEEKIRMKENELEEMRKTTLTKEQTACLLQELRHLEEKFQQAQMEKSFFKQQWHNALKEVHTLKAEDQRQLQQDIRKKKEELSQLSLDATADDSGDNQDAENDPNYEIEGYLY